MVYGKIRSNLRKLRDELIFPIFQFPLMATLLFGSFFLLALIQFTLFALMFMWLTFMLHNGMVPSVPSEVWSLFIQLALLLTPLMVGCLLATRYSWKLAKVKHPNLSAPRT